MITVYNYKYTHTYDGIRDNSDQRQLGPRQLGPLLRQLGPLL